MCNDKMYIQSEVYVFRDQGPPYSWLLWGKYTRFLSIHAQTSI